MKSDLCLNVFYYSLSWPKRSIFFRACSTSSRCLDLIHPAASLAFNTPSLAITLQASIFQLWEEASENSKNDLAGESSLHDFEVVNVAYEFHLLSHAQLYC